MNNTVIEGELFPNEGLPPQDTTTAAGSRTGDKSMVEELKELRELCTDAGIYESLPTEALLPRGEAFYNNNAPQVREFLTASGVAESTINAALNDYARALMGFNTPVAAPQQMNEVLCHLKPYRAFYIERYALYWGVCVNWYARYLNVLNAYQCEVKNTDSTATNATRDTFMDSFYSAEDSGALAWLIDTGVITPADFIGVEPSRVTDFLNRARTLSTLAAYCQYVFIAKYALSATPEELADITPPPIKFKNVEAVQFAIKVADDTAAHISDNVAQFAKLFEAERGEVAEAVKQNFGTWGNKDTLTLNRNITNISARAPMIAPDGDIKLGKLPIQKAIDEFMAKNGDKYGAIRKGDINRAIETINILSSFGHREPDGRQVINTTLNEFCRYANLIAPNQEQQRALLGALLVISDLYLIVERPRDYVEITKPNGKVAHRPIGGPTAMRVVSVKIEMNETAYGRGITIEIQPEVMRGKPTLIRQGQYKKMRENAAGNNSKSRFNYQILNAGHKNEEKMVAEVFAYDERRAEATTPEERKKVEKYIRGHHAANRRTLAKWFEEYAKQDIISYQYDVLTHVYKWQRLNVPQEKKSRADSTK